MMRLLLFAALFASAWKPTAAYGNLRSFFLEDDAQRQPIENEGHRKLGKDKENDSTKCGLKDEKGAKFRFQGNPNSDCKDVEDAVKGGASCIIGTPACINCRKACNCGGCVQGSSPDPPPPTPPGPTPNTPDPDSPTAEPSMSLAPSQAPVTAEPSMSLAPSQAPVIVTPAPTPACTDDDVDNEAKETFLYFDQKKGQVKDEPCEKIEKQVKDGAFKDGAKYTCETEYPQGSGTTPRDTCPCTCFFLVGVDPTENLPPLDPTDSPTSEPSFSAAPSLPTGGTPPPIGGNNPDKCDGKQKDDDKDFEELNRVVDGKPGKKCKDVEKKQPGLCEDSDVFKACPKSCCKTL